MNIKAILEYQQADLELKKLERELESSPSAKIMRSAQVAFKEAKETAAKIDKDAESLLNYYNKAKKFYLDNIAKIEAVAEKSKTDIDSIGSDKLKSQLASLTEQFTKIEKDLGAIQKRAEELAQEFSKANKKGSQSKKEFAEKKVEYDALKAQKAADFAAAEKKLLQIEKTVEKDVLEKYKALTKDRVYPAFVKLEAPNKCGGCRMEMALDSIGKLKQQGYISCESCRRIIYND